MLRTFQMTPVECDEYFGLNNILFKVLLTYYDIYIHTIFLGFDGKR